MADDQLRYLDPLALAKVGTLELQARLIVEGYLSGMHKSPYHGFSVEFAQHREYVPGDDIKHVDWKVYTRTGRFYLKQYEEETNLVVWLVLDISESMKYGSRQDDQKRLLTKYDYACMAAAAIAYLTQHQSDSIGFVTFDNAVRRFMKPSSQQSQFKEMINVMNKGGSREKSHMGQLFHDLADQMKRRSMVIVISDMFDNVPEILAGLRHLRHKRHEVILWQVLDPLELTFPFQETTLFRGLEQYPDLLTDPRSLRKSYLEKFGKFVGDLERGCRENNIDYVQMSTEKPLSIALSSYLAHRLKRA
ncbi:MAG: DUF58 domain-containing protein [Gemmataceae bacterium]